MTDTRTHPEEFKKSYEKFMQEQFGLPVPPITEQKQWGSGPAIYPNPRVRLSTDTAHNQAYMAWFKERRWRGPYDGRWMPRRLP